MLTVFYSPHATSVDNEAGIASGHSNVSLSVTGMQQARERRQLYAQLQLDEVFCSDLQRAAKTAELAFPSRVLPAVQDTRLRECDYGQLTLSLHTSLEGEMPQRIYEPFPNGESILMVVRRVGAFLGDVMPEYDGRSILIIGHRATKYGLDYWCGEPFRRIDEIVTTPWEWRDAPIWHYTLYESQLQQRSLLENER